MENAKKKQNQREDPEAAGNNNDATTYAKKKQKGTETESNQAELVRDKRFTKEEDELIKKVVLEYIETHALGDQGVYLGGHILVCTIVLILYLKKTQRGYGVKRILNSSKSIKRNTGTIGRLLRIRWVNT
ncbi:unnamed protein product [Brassica oleracea var. botrytis]|uniref:(rape) hypothetical protein n=1 Tax=Brassica napus TaxID=3708 RepID=A0A078FDX4_BRANA|nr:unnamed protein product [Brassica napus]CDY10288.1 BnaC05g29910D [Brassica napus]